MKKKTLILGIILIWVLVGIGLVFAQPQCKFIGDVKTREVERSDNYVTVSWLINIENPTDSPQKVYIRIQFLDKDGFQLEDTGKRVGIPPRTTIAITDDTLISIKVYSQIYKVKAVMLE